MATKTPGQATTYREWVSLVKAAGGLVANMPGDARTAEATPAARYPAKVWVPLCNNHVWSLPDAYSANGQEGYYRAPAVVIADSKRLGVATEAETKAGAKVLMDGWFDKIKVSLGSAGLILAAGAGVLFLLSRRKN